MTFSIIGRCKHTGQLGIAISSSSIAVGSRCPWLRSKIGAVATQNITLPSLGPLVLDKLESLSVSPSVALSSALETDVWRQHRQVIAMDARGRIGSFNGMEALGVNAIAEGNECIAAGNLLSGVSVVESMVSAFDRSEGQLADRLMIALRTAVAAGGEAGPVHSAALKVVGEVSWPVIDLRIDWADKDPVEKLGQLWIAFEPQMRDYIARALCPASAPSYGVPGDE